MRASAQQYVWLVQEHKSGLLEGVHRQDPVAPTECSKGPFAAMRTAEWRQTERHMADAKPQQNQETKPKPEVAFPKTD